MGFICAKYFSLLLIEVDFIKTGLKRKFIVIPGESNSKALIKLGNIVAENFVAGTWFLVHVILPGVAKLTENKQNWEDFLSFFFLVQGWLPQKFCPVLQYFSLFMQSS